MDEILAPLTVRELDEITRLAVFYDRVKKAPLPTPTKVSDFFRMLAHLPWMPSLGCPINKDFMACISCGAPKEVGKRPGSGGNLWFCESCCRASCKFDRSEEYLGELQNHIEFLNRASPIPSEKDPSLLSERLGRIGSFSNKFCFLCDLDNFKKWMSTLADKPLRVASGEDYSLYGGGEVGYILQLVRIPDSSCRTKSSPLVDDLLDLVCSTLQLELVPEEANDAGRIFLLPSVATFILEGLDASDKSFAFLKGMFHKKEE